MWKYKQKEVLGIINDFLNFRISVLSKYFTVNTHCPIYSISSFQRQKEQIQPQQPIQALKQVKQPDSNTQVISQWTESGSKICLKACDVCLITMLKIPQDNWKVKTNWTELNAFSIYENIFDTKEAITNEW